VSRLLLEFAVFISDDLNSHMGMKAHQWDVKAFRGGWAMMSGMLIRGFWNLQMLQWYSATNFQESGIQTGNIQLI
jgi:hypothetical protein